MVVEVISIAEMVELSVFFIVNASLLRDATIFVPNIVVRKRILLAP